MARPSAQPPEEAIDDRDENEQDQQLPPEARFAERGTFEGAYGEGSREAWHDEQAAQRADRPAPEISSGMGGSTTGYDPDSGFADNGPAEGEMTDDG